MTSPDSGGRRADRKNPEAVEIYKLIQAESIRLLADQQAELATIRTRTVQYLALIGTATAFLVGTALSGGSRDSGFFFLAGISSAVFILTLALGMQVLTGCVWRKPDFMDPKPRRADGQPTRIKRKWHAPETTFHFSAQGLMVYADNPIEVGKDRYYDHVAMLKRMSLDAEKYYDRNNGYIGILKRSYQRCIVAGFLQLLLWGAAAWRYGAPAA